MAEDLSRDTSFFDRIKELVPLEDYLRDHCGVEFVSDGPGRLAACCPFHAERTPSFKVTDSPEHDWQAWRCYGGCQGSDKDRGTVIDAVMKREVFDEAMDAARWLNEEYDLGLSINTEAYKRFEEIRQKARARIEVGRDELTKGDSTAAKAAKKYFASRGFSQETADHFNLGVDTEMTKAGRLSIPLYDKENHPVSVDGRSLFDSSPCQACGQAVTAKEVHERYFETQKAEQRNKTIDFDWKACPHCDAPSDEAKISWLLGQYPKYKFQAKFDKSKLLYHQFEAKRALLRDGRRATEEQQLFGLFLVEGYADCWAGWQAGQGATCSYNGAVLSDWQARNAVEVALHSGVDSKPIILVPDMDATGKVNVERNIAKLHSVRLRPEDPPLEIQVVMGIDELHYVADSGADIPCKDLGDVLQYLGEEATTRLLRDNRRPAEEWTIRGILDARMSDGSPFFGQLRQMELIGQVLQNVKHKSGLDYLIPLLAERWHLEPREARRWFQLNHSKETTASHQALIADIYEAHEDALAFLKHGHVIPIGYKVIDDCLPRGGVRKGWLAMLLGKSGTGKALSLDADILTPFGWKQMGEMEVGDEVVDPTTGGSARVTGVFPQGKRDLYRVTFSDGTTTECDREHLWTVFGDDKCCQVRTLDSLRDENLAQSPLYIPLTAPIDFVEQELPLDPYLLGELIAGGEEQLVAAEAGETLFPDGEWVLEGQDYLVTALYECGLWDLADEEKFIPELYKWARGAERLELLRGIMDNSVLVAAGKVTEYRALSLQLAEDVVFLVRSLGGTAVQSPWRSGAKVEIEMPAGLCPFKLSPEKSCLAANEPLRRIVSVEFSRCAEAQCISVDSQEQLYLTDDFIVTHNTMMSTQLLANMLSNHDVHAIMFSLEQKKGQLYERMACQILGRPPKQVEDLILAADPDLVIDDLSYPEWHAKAGSKAPESFRKECHEALEKVDEIFGNENLFIVDNVPTETVDAVEMSAERIQAIISEINMTKFKGSAADIVIIDHLSILKPGPEAPRNVQNDELQSSGYIMERLFQVCKAADVFMLVLQQLPKDVPAGIGFAKDAGRGGSKQTDYCDIILGAWRPEQEMGLEDDEKASRLGQYKLALLKNRYGAEIIAHLMFDTNSLRIVPAARVRMPDDDIADQPRVDIPEAESPAGAEKESGDPLIVGLGEEEMTTINTHEMAQDLGLVPEDDDSEENLGTWDWD